MEKICISYKIFLIIYRESFRFNTWNGLTGVLVQTIIALAVAERELRFEHRDLHWGNLLIRDDKKKDSRIQVVIDGITLNIMNDGLVASIIDFNLSRLEGQDGRVYALALTDDEELFEGEGDMQFDVYRRMRDGLGEDDDWNEFRPETNVYWIEYIVDKLVTFKLVGKLGKDEEYVKTLEAFGERCKEYNSAIDVVCEDDFIWESIEYSGNEREHITRILRSPK